MSNPVSDWLHNIGLGQYASQFEAQDIDHELLADLDQQTLKDIGVESAGHRLRILKAIRALESSSPAPAPEDTPTESGADELAGWSRTPGERKPVTMLFADIVGSTALTERLDAEEAHELLYRATRSMCRAVEENGGTVCRFMGDGIMAMFGAPRASERHALEACRAALAMQREIRDFAAQLESRYDAGLQARVGLHSGEVVVLEVGDDPDNPEYDASGPTVPLAARMEQSAEPGGILITDATRQLAGEYVEVEAGVAIPVKGVSEPVPVYRLLKVLSAATAAAATRQPFVGRRIELAQFKGLLDVCLESGYGKTVYIRGEAGIGKTRLVDELTHAAGARGLRRHKALVLDFGAGKGQGAIPSLLRSLLEVPASGGKKGRQQALLDAERDGIANPEHRVYLNDLLDLPQPLELRTMYDAMDAGSRAIGKRDALVEIVRNRASREPVLIVIEDLHWADEVTLDYLASLAAAVTECPALLVMTSRIEGDPLDRAWRAQTGESSVITWDLAPLRREESISLVSGFIDSRDELAQQCIERAAGNPLFLEQLLLSVQKGQAEILPDSIRSLVLTRLDHLPGDEKQALQAAAVLGQRFELDVLRYLLGDSEFDCRNLIEHRLIRPEGVLYLFAHALIQEACYASLLKRQRAELHRRAADWYREHDSILHAEHLDQAGDERAAHAYLEAALQQSAQFRPWRALQLAERGLELASDGERFELQILAATQLQLLGRLPESIDAFTRAREAANDDPGACRALVGIALAREDSGTPEKIVGILHEAETIAKAHGLDSELARIFHIRGGLAFFECDIQACFENHRQALEFARRAGSPDLIAHALSGFGDAEYCRGRSLSALRYFDECISLAREHGIGKIIAANLSMKALIVFWQGDFSRAIEAYDEARELAAKTHNLRAEMINQVAGSYIWMSLGLLDDTETCILRALALARQLGTGIFEGNALAYLSRLRYFQGRLAESFRAAKESLDILSQTESGIQFGAPTSYGMLALSTDDEKIRRQSWQKAEAILGNGSLSHTYFNFYEDSIEACLRIGDWDQAERFADALEAYTSAEPVLRSEFDVARGRALAAFGRGRRDDELIAEIRRLCQQCEDVGFRLKLPALEAALAGI